MAFFEVLRTAGIEDAIATTISPGSIKACKACILYSNPAISGPRDFLYLRGIGLSASRC